MDKEEFLQILSRSLRKLPEKERCKILDEYHELLYTRAQPEGGPQDVTENPWHIGRIYRAEYHAYLAEKEKKIRHLVKAVLLASRLGAGYGWVIVSVFAALVLVNLFFYGIAVSIAATGVAVILSVLLETIYPLALELTLLPTAVVFIGIGTACLGILTFIGNCFFTSLLFAQTVRQIQQYIHMVRQGRGDEKR